MSDKKEKDPFTVTTSLNLPNMLDAKKESIKKFKKNKGNRITNQFSKIEHVYAENGIVNVLMQNGDKTTMTPTEAFSKCRGIHEMAMRMRKSAKLAKADSPMSKRAQTIEQEAAITMHKVQKFIAVATEARHQLETNTGKSQGIFGLMHGRDYQTGKAIHVKDSIASQMDFYKIKCFTLTEDEIHTILSVDPEQHTMAQRDKILMGEHSNRMHEFNAENINNMDDLPQFKK